jgi:cephalosporin-C deacetylase
VTFAGFAGDPIRGWLTLPAGARAAGEPLPAVVEYVGYGGGRGVSHERLLWAAAGYVHLVMDTRGQGATWGNGGHTPDPEGSGPAAPGVMTRGIADPYDYYYRRLITDAVRAVDAVRALPFVDASRVGVLGVSQGGGLALAVSGLAQGLAGVMADVPFLCHFPRALSITDSYPYHEVVTYLGVHRDQRDAVMRTLSYVDGVHLARRADAPALFSVALRDDTCPPSTVFAAYNHYGTLGSSGAVPGEVSVRRPSREIEVYEFNTHEGGEGFQRDRQLRWFTTLTG